MVAEDTADRTNIPIIRMQAGEELNDTLFGVETISPSLVSLCPFSTLGDGIGI